MELEAVRQHERAQVAEERQQLDRRRTHAAVAEVEMIEPWHEGGLAQHPFAVHQRWRESIKAEAMWLMAGGAKGGVYGFAFLKQGCLRFV